MASSTRDVKHKKFLPKRIILVRHGESAGNLDENIYSKVPDHRLVLTPKGIDQARQAGTEIVKILDDSSKRDWKAYFYVSPYTRTRSTLKEIALAFPKGSGIGVREECRMREQDFGNFQNPAQMKLLKIERNNYGRFYYRFPEGESGADAYDRICGFMESLWRDIDNERFPHDAEKEDLNIVIVTHGLAMRLFLMKWFRWTVEQFETLKNPKNCEYRIMELGVGGEYSLAVYHDDATLTKWGFSAEMIQDQKNRALGLERKEDCLWFDTFFHPSSELQDSSTDDAAAAKDGEVADGNN